jgi:hypothetical protein
LRADGPVGPVVAEFTETMARLGDVDADTDLTL